MTAAVSWESVHGRREQEMPEQEMPEYRIPVHP